MQVTRDLFEQILLENESERVDFKRDQYPLNNDVQKSEFIKDVVSIANTKRNKPGYIVLGIKAEPNGKKVKFDIKVQYDDAILQQIVKDKLNPPPRFTYNPYQVLSSFGPTDTALLHIGLLSRNLKQPVFTEDHHLAGECRKKEVSVLRVTDVLSIWQQYGSK